MIYSASQRVRLARTSSRVSTIMWPSSIKLSALMTSLNASSVSISTSTSGNVGSGVIIIFLSDAVSGNARNWSTSWRHSARKVYVLIWTTTDFFSIIISPLDLYIVYNLLHHAWAFERSINYYLVNFFLSADKSTPPIQGLRIDFIGRSKDGSPTSLEAMASRAALRTKGWGCKGYHA